MTSLPANSITKRFSAKVYQAVWRWHFWAGLLISPVLVIVSITGALYVFKPELERVMYPEIMLNEGISHVHAGFDTFANRVEERDPTHKLHFINVSKDPARNWEGFAEVSGPNGTRGLLRYYYNPRNRKIAGTLDNETSFFRVVLAIHRRLMGGTPGRIIVEVAVSWTIITVLTGAYLWWPRKKGKVRGVWIPRNKGSVRSLLRDWHAIPAIYLSIFIVAIMVTGLLFTKVWGTAFRASVFLSGGFPEFFISPPKSVVEEGAEMPADSDAISIDQAVATGFNHFDFHKAGFGLDLPHSGSNDAFSITTDTKEPFSDRAAIFIDRFSGETLAFATNDDLPWQTKAVLLFYPIHVGSIFGLATKVLAVISCLLLIAMSVTGVWMWWKRKPIGTIGAPRKTPAKTIPAWIAWFAVALAVFLPLVGLTLIFLFLIDWTAKKISKPLVV
ncbi:MAG: PepSY domain-containing protein [Verrucomicrobiota bacterium]